MAKKLRRPGQLSAKATEMRNAALKASEATRDFDKMNPIEFAMSWTNAENILAPWGSGVKSQVNFFEGHAMDFPMSSDSLNSVIKDAANKAKVELGLDKLGIEPTVQINYGVNEQIMKNSMDSINLGSYVPNDSMIRINVDSIWDTVKNNGGSTMDDLIERVTETVSHEMRHMYQFEGKNKDKWDKRDNKWKQKKIKKNMPDTYDTWLRDPIEKDAVAYQKKFTRRNVNDIKNNLLNRQTREYELLQRQLQKEQPFRRGEGTWRIADNNFDYSPIEFDLSGLDIPNNSVDIQDSKNYRKLKKGEGTYRLKSEDPQTVEPRISDLDDNTLSNLTDEEIIEWAQNSDDYNEAIELRKNARKKLGMDTVPEIETTGKNTELETTLNNNLNNRTSNTNTNTSTIDNTEETIEEKIKRLTEEERQRFERESQADFNKSMGEIEAEFNQEAERIENEFGPAKYNLDDTSLHLDDPDVKIRKQRLENAGKRLSNNKGPNGTKKRFTGQRVANNSKRSIKKRKLSGKKFKVKSGNLKQAAANTFVNIATDAVKETISKNADELKNFGRHPNMFDFDEFADLTDADIDFYYDNLFGMDIKTKQQMKKSWIEKRKLAKTARKSANKRKIIDNFDDYMDNVFSYTGYSSIEGQARFSPDPEVGWDEADFKNPDSYNRHRIDFEVDDDGNLKFKRYDEMDTIEIEQNKSRRIKSNIDDDDIFGWMKKHKIGLGEAINVLSTVSAYKDARKQGHSVGSSVVRAAGSFVMGEMLGFWGSMGWELAKGIPKAAIKGAEVLYKENRKMNAAANQHGLGGDFQDTQQLATMRQSGMEMAKMAQYNLQQTLMGNEATHLHR
jgi:hypothetical protein